MIDTDEFYEESSNKSTYSDRYRNCKILKDIDSGEVLLSTREDYTIPYNHTDKYHRVSSNEISRLDIIAGQYYKNPLLWWVIAQANNIYDPFTPLSPGTLLRIPGLETLYGNNGVLL